MHLIIVLVLSVGLVTSAAIPGSSPFSPIPGYPLGTSCLNDNQAQFIAEQYRSILANTDRQKANATAQVLLSNTYSETSDSIDILAGLPLGSPTFQGKQQYIQSAISSPALPGFVTIKVYHDCTNVIWQWRLTGLGSGKYPVKGFNQFAVNPITGVIQSAALEFNSIAWGDDTGWTCTPPPSR